jgi:hypothetical protein
VHIFLFNDMLLYAAPLPDLYSRPQYQFLGRFDSGHCEIFSPEDGVPSTSKL